MNEHTDENLVGAVLAGDAESFCTLARRYQDHAYGIALGILADFDLALDAAQEAFLCAYCQLSKLKDPARFGAWLCGIARNTAREVLRNKLRQETLAKKAAEHSIADPAAPPACQLAGAAEERVLVQQALLRIRDADRGAITLYYMDGLRYADICSLLEITEGTLKGRLQRGRKALRKELTMVEQVCKDNAPDEEFARNLARTISVFAAKGPSENHIPSTWHQSLFDETGEILSMGEEGFRIDLALSHSGSAIQRTWAATRFGLRKDGRSLSELERMLEDRSAKVRKQALSWYAALIHPVPEAVSARCARSPASTAPPQLDHLLSRMTDENCEVRLVAVRTVGAYLNADDPRPAAALHKALEDPKHKVQHEAAKILNTPCPGCGRTW